MSPREKLHRTAFHEAGHSIVAIYLQTGIKKVSIVLSDGSLGMCTTNGLPKWFNPDIDRDSRTKKHVEDQVMIFLAGHIAETKFSGRRNWRGASEDQNRTFELASSMCGTDEETNKYVSWLEERTENLLERRHIWKAVTVLAKALVKKKELPGKEVRRLFYQSMKIR